MSEPAAPPTLRERVCAAPATWILCGVNVAVFLAAEHAGDTTSTATLVQFGASERSHVWAGEYWRFFTPMFLHIGWVHLIWNTYVMIDLCSALERVVRTPRFLATYLATGVGATAVSLLAHDAVSAGASGAGFGVIGALLMLLRQRLGSWAAFFGNAGVKRTLVIIAIWFALGFTVLPMDNFAHLGGLVFGLLMGWVISARPIRRLAAAGVVLAVVLTLSAAASPWPARSSFWRAHESAVAADEALRRGDFEEALRQLERARGMGYRDRMLAETLRDAVDSKPQDWPYRARFERLIPSFEER